MNKAYVQEYIKLEKTHWWFLVRQKIILWFLKRHLPATGIKILNIGAAGGESTRWLSSIGKVTSVETDPFFIEYLKLQQSGVVNAPVDTMPFADNSFDLVCAFDVIEHAADDVAAMKEMKRVCSTGGLVCITVPAFKMLWSGHDEVNAHYRRYTKGSLASLGEMFPQLQEQDMRYFNCLLFPFIFIARKLSRLFSSKQRTASDFTYYGNSAVAGSVFKLIFSIEIPLIRFLRFPFGVSLIAAWKKTGVK